LQAVSLAVDELEEELKEGLQQTKSLLQNAALAASQATAASAKAGSAAKELTTAAGGDSGDALQPMARELQLLADDIEPIPATSSQAHVHTAHAISE